MDTTNYHRTRPLFRGAQIVWYILDILEVLLGFRFLLRLLGANPAAGFTRFIYDASAPFVDPFANVFRFTYVQGRVLEWTTLLAMVIYWLIAWGIIRLFIMGRPVTDYEAANKLERHDKI